MSMNLAFQKGKAIADFPFQTPTVLTRAVLAAVEQEKRLQLIENELKAWGWTVNDRQACRERVIEMLAEGWRLIEI